MALHVAVAMLVALLAWPVQALWAQGFSQPFLGNGPPPRLYGYGAAPRRSLYFLPRPYQPEYGGDAALPERPASYRTLCVRLCDGYYFPISSAAPSSGLSRDADTCSASCGSEARLFYFPNAGGDVETMTDLTGLAYSSLPNAFMYRKALVPECRCRPQPWSEAERERHRGYQDQPAAADTPAGTASPAERGLPRQSSPAAVDRADARPRPAPRDTWPGPSAWPSAGAGSGGTSKSYYVWPGERRYRY